MWQHLTDAHHNQGPSRIDSVQNGLLLTATLHVYWDSWMMSINPVGHVGCYHWFWLEQQSNYFFHQRWVQSTLIWRSCGSIQLFSRFTASLSPFAIRALQASSFGKHERSGTAIWSWLWPSRGCSNDVYIWNREWKGVTGNYDGR